MGKYIIKLQDESTKKDIYFEWSEIVDAPISDGLSRKNFENYYKEKYGIEGLKNFDTRMQRVDEKGISAFMFDNVEELISSNCAGPNGTKLTAQQIINNYTNPIQFE